MQKRILIIEDEENVIELLKARLESVGYKVYEASNGEDGYSSIRANNPDLILLDVMLPKVDGYTLCKKIKDDDSFKHIPIIMISARCQKSDIELGNEAGADEYMLKPYDPLELLQVIEKYLI